MPWLSSRPPGPRSSRAAGRSTSPSCVQPDVLEHADRADRVVRARRRCRGSPGTGSRPGRRARRRRPAWPRARPAAATASRRPPARRGAAAACRTMPPQPQPMSSSRIPGSRPSFVQTSSYLFACAASSLDVASVHTAHEYVIDGPSTMPVEVVRDVVVVRDRGRVALLGVAPAVQPRLFGRRRERLQPARSRAAAARRAICARRDAAGPTSRSSQREHREDVALEVELAGDVRAARARARRAR